MTSTKAVETPSVPFAEECSCSKAGMMCAIATEELSRKFSWYSSTKGLIVVEVMVSLVEHPILDFLMASLNILFL